MIEIPTCIILGAGASKPYGFPTGVELLERISASYKFRSYQHVEGQLPEKEFFLKIASRFGESELKKFVTALEQTQYYSIDKFISKRADCAEIAKYSVGLAIRFYETKGTVFGHANNWYRILLNSLNEDHSINKQNISIITFNYDRSLEHYLFTAVHQRTQSLEVTKRFMEGLNIIHVHGAIAPLEWQDTEKSKSIAYSKIPQRIGLDDDLIFEHSKNLSVIYDNSSNVNTEISSALSRAQKVLFLGLGFHKENMEKIGYDTIKNKVLRASRYQLKGAKFDTIYERYPEILYAPDHMDCYQFLEEEAALEEPLVARWSENVKIGNETYPVNFEESL